MLRGARGFAPAAFAQTTTDAANILFLKQEEKMARDVYQALYDELTALGSRSLADALTVGVIIEETDTADLDAMLEATRESVIRRVMTNLRNGSYSHLEAFNRALDQPVSSSGSSAPAGKPQGRVQRQRGRW